MITIGSPPFCSSATWQPGTGFHVLLASDCMPGTGSLVCRPGSRSRSADVRRCKWRASCEECSQRPRRDVTGRVARKGADQRRAKWKSRNGE
jgi:hypothetical protein